jgi:DNA-binding CsgD family transcriptional regulator
MIRTTIDASEQLLFQRFGHGIKLIKPKSAHANKSLIVDDVLRMPINIYFSNSNGITEKCNEVCAFSCGYDSINEAIGKSPFDSPNVKREYNLLCIRNNREIMASNRLKFIEEEVYRTDDSGFQTLSIKLPWYDGDNKTIGIVGCSIVIGQQPLAESLSTLMQLGLLKPNLDFANNSPPLTGRQIGDVYFSKREFECLSLLTRGKSARDIGNMLGLSHRTVEQYLASIKFKLKVKTKSELIDKAINYF